MDPGGRLLKIGLICNYFWKAVDCGLITEKCRGFFAKHPRLTAPGRLTGHVARRDRAGPGQGP